MKPHTYAEVLGWIAAGERVQWLDHTNVWQDQRPSTTLNEIARELYGVTRYRKAPRTIKIGNREVEAPILNPKTGETVYRKVSRECRAVAYNQVSDRIAAEGRYFASPEAAIAAHDAIVALLRGEG